jgi:hypothetical protein
MIIINEVNVNNRFQQMEVMYSRLKTILFPEIFLSHIDLVIKG